MSPTSHYNWVCSALHTFLSMFALCNFWWDLVQKPVLITNYSLYPQKILIHKVTFGPVFFFFLLEFHTQSDPDLLFTSAWYTCPHSFPGNLFVFRLVVGGCFSSLLCGRCLHSLMDEGHAAWPGSWAAEQVCRCDPWSTCVGFSRHISCPGVMDAVLGPQPANSGSPR